MKILFESDFVCFFMLIACVLQITTKIISVIQIKQPLYYFFQMNSLSLWLKSNLLQRKLTNKANTIINIIIIIVSAKRMEMNFKKPPTNLSTSPQNHFENKKKHFFSIKSSTAEKGVPELRNNKIVEKVSPESFHQTRKNSIIKTQVMKKRSLSPQVKFNYINHQNQQIRQAKCQNSLIKIEKETNVQADFTNQFIKRTYSHGDHTMNKREYIKEQQTTKKKNQCRKITNLAYTSGDYDASPKKTSFKDIKPPNMIRIDKHSDYSFKKDANAERNISNILIPSLDDTMEFHSTQRQFQKVRKNDNFQIQGLERVKSQVLEDDRNFLLKKVSEIEQQNRIYKQELENKKNIIIQLEQKNSETQQLLKNVQNNARKDHQQDDIRIKQKNLEIKKLQNHIGFLKLNEKEMESTIKKLQNKVQFQTRLLKEYEMLGIVTKIEVLEK